MTEYLDLADESILEKVDQMVRRQYGLQQKVASDWLVKDWDYIQAALMEIAEFDKSYWVPWWSKAEQDLVNCRIELVDAWHFILCDLIKTAGTITGARDTVMDGLTITNDSLRVEDWTDTINCSKHLKGLLIANAEVSIVEAFFLLCNSIGFQFDQLYSLYMAKNTLNGFRQKHGYKQGLYHKLWDKQREDNYFLTHWVSSLDYMPEQDEIEEWLEQTYKSMTNKFWAIQDLQ